MNESYSMVKNYQYCEHGNTIIMCTIVFPRTAVTVYL